ncbi:MAG: hypothetical protein M1826_005398 [Phylliscum demangeonii]|nr:MAG: hypothetical protein M1826_005398 [Phylliscum demangeonii]
MDPDLVTTKMLGANASSAACAAHTASRKLNYLRREGRAYGLPQAQLPPDRGPRPGRAGKFIANLFSITKIPKATRTAATKALQAVMPALPQLYDKAMQVYLRFVEALTTAPCVQLEWLSGDLMDDGLPTSALSLLEHLDDVATTALVEADITSRAQPAAPTVFEEVRAGIAAFKARMGFSVGKWNPGKIGRTVT